MRGEWPLEKQSDLLLDIEHLHTAYRLHGKFYDAADDINLTLKRNEILAVVGESGCGKVQLLQVLLVCTTTKIRE